MKQEFIDKTFDKRDYKENPLKKGEYENCSFTSCDLSGTDLSDIMFIDCRFTGCNLSLANINNTVFRDCVFGECKLLGLRFDSCNKFGLAFRFEQCTLNHSSYYKTKIQGTLFKNSQLQEADFSECDLTGSVFDHCDLTRALFEQTILEKADLRNAYNFSIDPERNRLKKARFSLTGVPGLLDKYHIDIDKAI
jgi:uncharacterized protein YjbI with pentapeptide repeats